MCYQIIVIWNAREGLRLRREYSVSSRKWGEASPGVDGKNRPCQSIRFGSVRDQSGRSPKDTRRFLPAFEALLKVTPEHSRDPIDHHKEAALKGSLIDICKLCGDLCEILDLLAGKLRRDFAEAAKTLLCRVVLHVPLTPNPAALPPIRLYTNDLEAVPVAT